MKSRKKLILVCACALVLAVVTVAGTLAYLTDTDETVNTFVMGKVKIDLSEPSVANDGQSLKVVPGRDIPKDPTLTVLEGSEDSYVRMILTMTNAAELQSIVDRPMHQLGGSFANLLYTYADDGSKVLGYNSAWVFCGSVVEGDTISFEFRYNDVVAGSSSQTVLPVLFDGLNIPGTLTGDELATLGADFEITVVAHAVQKEGFTDADSAWAAFDNQMAAIAAENANNNNLT